MSRFLGPLRETRLSEIVEVLYGFNDSLLDIKPLTDWLLDQIRVGANLVQRDYY